VQQQVAVGVELILGITLDPALGPALVVGLGGVYAEVLRDVSVRPLPITERDAYEMVDELRGRPLLDGVRGGPAVDVEAFVRVMLGLARLAWEHPVVELDLNPVIAGPAGVVAVDSVIMVEQ
jgi:hypothetical protein